MQKIKASVKGISFTVGVCCPNDAQKRGIQNWSLKHVRSQQDVSEGNPLAAGLRSVLKEMGTHKAYAPHVAASSAAIVATHEVLWENIHLGEERILSRNRSVEADGLFLGRGRSYIMTGKGCPIIVASDGRDMIVSHAGRDSLVGREWVAGRLSKRPHISVVESIVKAFTERGACLSEIEMAMLFSIPEDAFEHPFDEPTFGPYNRALTDFVARRWPGSVTCKNRSAYLNLEMLFEAQAEQLGINAWTSHPICEFPNLAYPRDSAEPRTDEKNLIVVKRNN